MNKIPSSTTVENMAQELDVIADLKAAETLMNIEDLTLGFDATTQDGIHINSIHMISKTDCEVLPIDELPGGTEIDFSDHITSTVDHLANGHASYHKKDHKTVAQKMISNI